jgi:protease I
MARVAFIVDQLFEDSEFRVPYERVRGAGHEAVVIAVDSKEELAGKRGQEKVKADRAIDQVGSEEFDALVIPGGFSPDRLRTNRKMVGLTRDIFNAGKPVAAICHAGWMLVEADIADGRTVTSWPSIKTDLINAGARWVDREVVEDENLITSRKPEDLEAFSTALLRQIEHGAAEPMRSRVGGRGEAAEAHKAAKP